MNIRPVFSAIITLTLLLTGCSIGTSRNGSDRYGYYSLQRMYPAIKCCCGAG